ncbi:TPA: hypothetical protein ACGUPG_004371 [Vibrio vulnificus]|uniref:hypothetical protein n=1 Tax=Vibrio vulnificus TaxID=672 RepID=UPI0005F0EA45|nr:hypothetical protein [Vibrio vulnificus]HCH1623010.1 hypothetical protein [Vibrio parahaemolyticus]EGR1425927.1 hypothetical protein [Vibrio vulnificus]EHT4943487.1 hypothetical protein [Vibrio vulnificus]EHU9451421.1 hypothetical protein [Vibrio vulnificus]ELV8623148.1 hypothetical protein [Vibrio vulnificus]
MTREELLEKIERKEAQLLKAQSESNAWNRGKYNKSSNAKVSKIFVKSLESEISDLENQLSKLES